MNLEILIGFIMATLALAISPGPDNIFVLTLSLAHGSKKGLAVVAGLMTGCLIHTTLVAFGVSTLIREKAELFWIVKILGVVYLLYLSFLVYKSDGQIQISSSEQEKKGEWSLFKKGFFMNVLNPKVTIFFLAFFPGFLFSAQLPTVIQFYVLGLLFIVVSSLVFGSIALGAGSVSKFLSQTPKVGVFLRWMQIVVFLGIAIYLLIA
ncbi:LysE family translocator [Croceivirga lutea]|uniref:LysE family translocator n=1 Tax=Croceivirga lutea TaxID=1775167 RepID=UPI0016394E9D|nr:LysE family translocator [Croceivirga lutea]GGG49821.1 LysE family translocator [Croceivirga lutea]